MQLLSGSVRLHDHNSTEHGGHGNNLRKPGSLALGYPNTSPENRGDLSFGIVTQGW